MTKIRTFVLVMGDIFLAFLALFFTLAVRYLNNFHYPIFYQHLLPFGFIYFVWLLFFYVFGLYDLEIIRPKGELTQRIIQCFVVCLIIGLIFFYLVPAFGIAPKRNLLLDIFIFGLLIFAWRRLFYSLFSTFYQANIAFLGKTKLATSLAEQIKKQPQLGYQVVGFLNQKINLQQQLKKWKINYLIISDDFSQNQLLAQKLYACLPLKVSFLSLDRAYEQILGKIPVDFVNQAWFLKNLSEHHKSAYEKIKRIIDILISSLLLFLTSPLWLFIALAIKLDDKGPVFYRQERVSKDNKIFRILKFRSMVVNAEKMGAMWAKKNDPRLTRVGKFLKKFHLDEFPQMVNVLKGDISLVGPRPERPEFVRQLEKEIPHYHLRHIVKPGFTGWAQVKFVQYARSLQDSHEKFQYDLYYIKNRSFLLDLAILLKTFFLFFKTE
jgi:exopolysaccharide biosynthesis polyprenyl glycosylphosphotransferase